MKAFELAIPKSGNPYLVAGVRVNTPYWLDFYDNKIYLTYFIGSPTSGWNEVKCIDTITNKMTTLTTYAGLAYCDGGITVVDDNNILLAGITNPNNSNQSNIVRLLKTAGTWAVNSSEYANTWSHTAATYDCWMIRSLKHSKYNINGKQAFITGQYDNQTTTREMGLRFHYFNGTVWTNINLITKMPTANINNNIGLFGNGQSPCDLWEDPIDGRLFVAVMKFSASATGAVYLLTSASTGPALATISNWNDAIKLCGNTDSSQGGWADGAGNAAKFLHYLKFGGIKNRNVHGNPVLIVTDRINHRIRQIDTHTCLPNAGIVTTLAGSGVGGYANGIGTSAQLNRPGGACIINKGESPEYLVFAEENNQRLRKLNLTTNEVSNYAGDGIQGNINN